MPREYMSVLARVCGRILMVFHGFVCRYDSVYNTTTSVATAAAAKATPNALRGNRGRGTHNERKLRCWARTKQIDVANAGGRVLPLFFAISPCARGPPL